MLLRIETTKTIMSGPHSQDVPGLLTLAYAMHGVLPTVGGRKMADQ